MADAVVAHRSHEPMTVVTGADHQKLRVLRLPYPTSPAYPPTHAQPATPASVLFASCAAHFRASLLDGESFSPTTISSLIPYLLVPERPSTLPMVLAVGAESHCLWSWVGKTSSPGSNRHPIRQARPLTAGGSARCAEQQRGQPPRPSLHATLRARRQRTFRCLMYIIWATPRLTRQGARDPYRLRLAAPMPRAWHGGWGMALMIIGNLIFWGLLITVAVLLARYIRLGRISSPAEVSPNR